MLRCLDSLYGSRDMTLQVVVVDNGSMDDSGRRIRARFPQAHLIALNENKGLAKGRNQGIQWALARDFPAILLVDDDVTLAPETAAMLHEALRSSTRAAIVTPRIVDQADPDRIWFDGGKFGMFGAIHVGMGETVASRPPMTQPTLSAFGTGCCMLVRREALVATGGFQEDYGVYCEDSDFCLRVQEHGYSVLHVSGAIALHEQSADTIANKGKWYRDYYVTRNNFLLAHRHTRGVRRMISYAFLFQRYVTLPAAYFTMTLQWKRLRAVAQGLSDFLAGRFGQRFS